MSRYTITVTGPEGTKEFKWPSATEIIESVYAKNGLQDWYYKEAVLGVSKLMAKFGGSLPADVPSLHSLMKSEGHSPYAQRDTAATAGTAIHTAVKTLAHGRSTKTVKEQYPALYGWWKERDFRKANILGAEETLVSFTQGYCGTFDLVYTENGEVTLSDVKSGKIRDSHALQLEAYRQAWEELGGVPIDRYSIIQVPRDGSEVTETLIEMTPELTEAWRSVLSVYRWQKKK